MMIKEELFWCLERTSNPKPPETIKRGDGCITINEEYIVVYASVVPMSDSKGKMVSGYDDSRKEHYFIIHSCRVGWNGEDNTRSIIRINEEVAKFTRWFAEYISLHEEKDNDDYHDTKWPVLP